MAVEVSCKPGGKHQHPMITFTEEDFKGIRDGYMDDPMVVLETILQHKISASL